MYVLNDTFAQAGLKIPKLTHNSWSIFFIICKLLKNMVRDTDKKGKHYDSEMAL